MIGYKLFRVKKNRPGELFPLYVLSDEPVPMGIWIDAEEGPRTPEGKVNIYTGLWTVWLRFLNQNPVRECG